MKILKILFCVVFGFASLQILADNNTGMGDAAITAKVKSKMVMDSNTSASQVNVTTKNGVVKIAGTVDSDNEASTMVEIAQSTDGVKNVDTSDLKVKASNQPITDTVITAKIKGLLLREKLFDAQNTAAGITVETKDGMVYLSGNLTNRVQGQKAVALAKSVAGVKGIKTNFKVINQ